MNRSDSFAARWPQALTAIALLLPVLSVRPCSAADEPTLTSKIAKVSLFKNGLALIERRATPGRAGTYQLDAAPTPVHGTLWIEGDRKLIARVGVRQREVEPQAPGDLQKDYAGRNVTVYLQDVNTPVTGKVRDLSNVKAKPSAAISGQFYTSAAANNGRSRFLLLDTERGGEALVDMSRIVYLEASGKTAGAKRPQPVLLLEVGEEAKGKEVKIRYLATGLSWAPTYHVDLLTKNRLRIAQSALVRNELTDFSDAEVMLISGFPNIRFRHVTSPLSPGANWSKFFSQLNRRPGGYSSSMGNSIATQQVAMNNFAPPAGGFDPSAIPSGDGVDLHYESIGRRTVATGEALKLEVDSAEAGYRRIVEWIVPDTHDAYGNRVDPRNRNRSGNSDADGDGDPWDALQFRNPLSMPMTTGPATITEGGRFNGQTISYWVSRGEQTTLKVTKALSIRTFAVENEQQGQSRDMVYIAGRSYGRVRVEGSLTIANHRAEATDVVVRRQFSGELISAEGDPKESRRQEGAYSINRRNLLTWSLHLEPGKTQKLTYQYQLLVRR